MKIILFLALITLATCELYHYQECVRGTTVLLKEPCSSGTYEGNSPFHPLADNKFALTCFSNSPIFLIVAAIVFITLCFTLKRKTE